MLGWKSKSLSRNPGRLPEGGAIGSGPLKVNRHFLHFLGREKCVWGRRGRGGNGELLILLNKYFPIFRGPGTQGATDKIKAEKTGASPHFSTGTPSPPTALFIPPNDGWGN